MHTQTYIGAYIDQNRARSVGLHSHFGCCSGHYQQNLQNIDEKVVNKAMRLQMGCVGQAVRIQDGQPWSKNLEGRRAEKRPRFLMVVDRKE